ncbi:MAG: response regulator transcription factor [Spirochaeta sp.]|nr:response regulator transcription factor [Spirochaeta sp.]
MVADDHPVLRHGLLQLLKESMSVACVYEVDNGNDVMDIVRTHHLDIVILDISLPGKDGMIVLAELKEEFPHIPVLMLSIQPESQYAARAFRLGAAGCVNKAVAPEELVRAVRQIANGENYINDVTSSVLLDTLRRPDTSAPHRLLSEREHQVMLRIASGKTLTEIGNELCLSVKTVSTYRSRLLEKMNLQNNSQLTHYVYKNRLMAL